MKTNVSELLAQLTHLTSTGAIEWTAYRTFMDENLCFRTRFSEYEFRLIGTTTRSLEIYEIRKTNCLRGRLKCVEIITDDERHFTRSVARSLYELYDTLRSEWHRRKVEDIENNAGDQISGVVSTLRADIIRRLEKGDSKQGST